MADKQWCPGCESCTSSLNEAYEHGWPCPYCGLSSAAWHEILQIQAARDDDKMAERFTELRVENDKLKRKVADLELKWNALKRTLEGMGLA